MGNYYLILVKRKTFRASTKKKNVAKFVKSQNLEKKIAIL